MQIDTAIVGDNPGPQWDIEGAGDFNSDTRPDILWQHDNGQVAVWMMDGSAVQSSVLVGANPGSEWQVVWA